MSDVQNVKIMQTYLDSLSKGDMDTVGKLLADDVTWHQPGNSHCPACIAARKSCSRIWGSSWNLAEIRFAQSRSAQRWQTEIWYRQHCISRPNGLTASSRWTESM